MESLIPSSKHIKPESPKENVFYVEVHKIQPNPNQPRQDFDEEGIRELAQSIRKYGVLQPLLVTKLEKETGKGLDVSYQLIAGERRLKAARLAGLPHVPVIIRDDFENKQDRLEVALIENLQRKDLNPIEEAKAYQRLAKEFGLTQQEIAQKVSKSREVIANVTRLLNLPNDIQESLRGGVLSRAHARALLAFNDDITQREIYRQILSGNLSSKEVEQLAASAKGSSKKSKSPAKENSRFTELENNLAEMLKAPVLIQSSDQGGKIIIKFATLEDLNKIAKSIID